MQIVAKNALYKNQPPQKIKKVYRTSNLQTDETLNSFERTQKNGKIIGELTAVNQLIAFAFVNP